MKVIRPVLLAVALSGSAAVLLPLESAVAEDPAAAAANLVEILPPTDVVADGKTPAAVYVLALGGDGKPLIGLKLKASASAGTADGWTDLGNGLYSFSFTPQKSLATQSVQLRVQGKTANKAVIDSSYT